MSNNYFKFKQFTIFQDETAMKVGVDSVLLGAWVDVGNAKTILDVGTGTGLLALMLAQKSKAHITAIEIDENAFHQAIENIAASKWKKQFDVIHSSFQKFVDKAEARFDLIICNPPYFSNSLKPPEKNRNTARHDDSLSLDDLFAGSKKLLKENASLNLIYPYGQKEQLFLCAKKHGFCPASVLHIKANDTKEPYRMLVKFVTYKAITKIDKMQLRNTETNNYTEEFKLLTQDYYL